MKIGIDLHGVVTDRPEFFKEFTKMLVDNGHEVHIITGPFLGERLYAEIKKYDLSYTHLFSIASYHQEIGTPMTFDAKGNPFLNEYLWDKTKGEYCLKHNIDLHFDDSDAYGYFFKTPFARFYSKDKRKHYVRDDSKETKSD